MFLWLLVFNQCRRLRPFYLPSGLVLFLAIAVPWHVRAWQANETWAHRYFVYEHWLRFMTPAASRTAAWWYYIAIILAGLIPWVGFLGPALRDRLSGGWKARERNAAAWFLVVWVVFIFLFFTKSHSKLPPYILPVFPALAVLIGSWLAKVVEMEDPRRLRVGLGLFSFVCGLFAVALCTVVLRPALVRMDLAQAAALKPHAFTMAGILVAGGVLGSAFARLRGPLAGLTAVFVTMAAFLAVLQFAAPHVQRPGTRELALHVRSSAAPGDRVMHYHEFFHDFTFYAERTVDLVDFKGELELEEDAAARASGRFLSEAEFRRQWTGLTRIWVVARRRDVKELFADPTFHYHLLGQSAGHYLFSNQP
jgi:hypothetical protein